MTYIYWKDLARTSYNYGTDLKMQGSSVYFENPLTPSSVSLHTWASQANYQASRQEPALPLLKREQAYQMTMVADIEPAYSLFVRVEFYNRFGESLGFELLKQDNLVFTYPKEAYTYTCKLINAGCQSFTFHYLKLEPFEEELENSQKPNSDDLTIHSGQEQLNIILVENGEELSEQLLSDLEKKMAHLEVYYSPSQTRSHLISSHLEGLLGKISETYPSLKINLLSYGPQGNFAGLYYAKRFSQVTAYINDCFLTLGKQMKHFVDLTPEEKADCRKVYQEKDSLANLVHYGFMEERPELNFVAAVISDSEQLRYLPELKE